MASVLVKTMSFESVFQDCLEKLKKYKKNIFSKSTKNRSELVKKSKSRLFFGGGPGPGGPSRGK